MGNFVRPKVFLIADTHVDDTELRVLMDSLGVPDWKPNGSQPTDAALLIEVAGKSCYNSFDADLNKNLTRANTKDTAGYIRGSILDNGHGSVLEHATVTFFIQDLSRIVTHEAVRHRVGTAFSQTSGRYVRLDKVNMFLPSCIEAESRAVAVFRRAMRQMEENLAELATIFDIENIKEFERKKELTSAFRRIIGNGQANNLVLTANHRAWRHMIAMRTPDGAEEEIRIVFDLIAGRLKAEYPEIYSDMHRLPNGEWEFENEHV